jgi:hypothetical protein
VETPAFAATSLMVATRPPDRSPDHTSRGE